MPHGFPGGHAHQRREVDNTRFYTLLGLEKTASTPDIKKAYKKLAIKHHPDKGGDSETFKEITRAYEVLSNPEKKSRYDQMGEEGVNNDDGGGGDPSDIFDMFFGGGGRGGGRQRQRQKTKDIVSTIKITLEQAYCGYTKRLAINRDVIDQDYGTHQCPDCDGRGQVTKIIQMGPMIQQASSQCPKCRGVGTSYKVKKQREIVEVNVEKGVPTGHKVTFTERSDELPGCDTGDVIFQIQLEDHKEFERKGNDLYIKKKITLLEALTGFSFVVTHLDGRQLIVKPPPGEILLPKSEGSSPTLYAVKGEGMPLLDNSFICGNLYILFDIVFPTSLTDAQKTQLTACLPAPAPSAPIDEDDAKYELHVLSQEDPKVQQSSGTGRGNTQAFDEDEEHGHYGGGGQRVECAQQ